MKKVLALLLALMMALTLCACGRHADLGDTVKKGIMQITLKDVQYKESAYLVTDKTSDDFLRPVSKDDLLNDDHDDVIAYKDDYGVVVVTLIVENIGKNDLNFYPEDIKVDYDNGNMYTAEESGYTKLDGKWKEFYDKITLEKVTSGPREIKVAVWVPNTAFESSNSLVLKFCGYSYVIK